MIKYFAIKIIKCYLAWKYKVKLHRNVLVSFRTKFEGGNLINQNVDLMHSYVGYGTFIAPNSDLTNTKIGRFCSIGSNVRTCLGSHPTRGFVSTHPAFFSLQKQAGFTFVQEQLFQEHKFVEKHFVTKIGNDVWIGNNVLIFDGLTIGDGAIIGAGSVVTKDIEPYSVNVGVPARNIRFRFKKEQIDFLLKFKWWEKDLEWIKKNASLFQNIDTFYSKYKNNI